MSDGPTGKYFSEAHRFEEDSVYLLRHLAPANDLESSKRHVRRLIEKCMFALYHSYLGSLEQRKGKLTKEKWLEVGRPTLKKIRADLKKYRSQLSSTVEKNVWRG